MKPVAQVVALEPEGPDGHGVNWLAGKRPKPGDLLFGGDAVARALAAKNEAETNALRAAQEADELRAALESVRQYGSDTLSGRTDGPDDRDWQRAAVLEMTRRAKLALGLRRRGPDGYSVTGIADLRDAKWLDPECADFGVCQSLKFKAAHPSRAPLTPEQVFANTDIMACNAKMALRMDVLMEIIRAVETAHGSSAEGEKT